MRARRLFATLALAGTFCAVALRPAFAAPAAGSTHRIVLPPPAPALPAAIDVTSKEAPSVGHPRGTMIVTEVVAGGAAPSVSEWDVMTGQVLREAALPLPSSFVLLHVVCAGGHVHVIASQQRGGEVVYARLDGALHVEEVDHIGRGFGAMVATDGSVVALLWSGTRTGAGDGRGWQMITMNTAGRRLAALRVVDSTTTTAAGHSPFAVVGGKVFLQDPPPAGLPPLLRYSADLQVEATYRPSSTPFDPSLYGAGGKLLIVDGCGFDLLDPGTLTRIASHAVPYKPERYPWCPSFTIASNAAGRLLTSRGDILAPSLDVERHVVDVPDGIAVLRPIWITGAAALLEYRSSDGSASIVWSDAGAP